jgi:hypothetical protein
MQDRNEAPVILSSRSSYSEVSRPFHQRSTSRWSLPLTSGLNIYHFSTFNYRQIEPGILQFPETSPCSVVQMVQMGMLRYKCESLNGSDPPLQQRHQFWATHDSKGGNRVWLSDHHNPAGTPTGSRMRLGNRILPWSVGLNILDKIFLRKTDYNRRPSTIGFLIQVTPFKIRTRMRLFVRGTACLELRNGKRETRRARACYRHLKPWGYRRRGPQKNFFLLPFAIKRKLSIALSQ